MNDAVQQLIDKLLTRTEAKTVQWTTVYDGVFRVEVGSGLVRISRDEIPSVDHDDNHYLAPVYTIAILNQDGRVAEEITTSSGNTFRTAEALYSAARRSALGTEELLRDMLSALSGKK